MSQGYVPYQNTPTQGGMMSCGVTRNQLNIDQLLQLRTTPGTVTCPFCGKTGLTIVDTSCNVCSLLFCIFDTPCYLCHICKYNRGCTCKDADHKCGSCGQVLFHYEDC